MEVLKCKMCGGELELTENASICKCKFCGSMQTLPREKSDTRVNAYNRAGHFFMNGDFDKALALYEKILLVDPEDANAYWSCILCKYGVTYVEDPKTKERKITVNRTQNTAVVADDTYKQAIKYATAEQRELFEKEAAEIDEIQKGILAISQNEEPFDVFISYKETDSRGERTMDSVLATDLYYGLTEAGYKVFLSRITLEDKLGSEYEPYIYAALNSAKVMIVLGTKPEYFNAPWVKNEWSRYLQIIKGDRHKLLIPAYRDMDAYDLPEEFALLQAQDMSKIGFLQDIIRGVKKVIGANAPLKAVEKVVEKTVVKETQTATISNNNIDPLITRAYMFLEDEEYDEADEYAERILDIDPKCADAYLIKLLAELELNSVNMLDTYNDSDINENKNFIKAYKFSNEEFKNKLDRHIKKTNDAYRLANNTRDRIDQLDSDIVRLEHQRYELTDQSNKLERKIKKTYAWEEDSYKDCQRSISFIIVSILLIVAGVLLSCLTSSIDGLGEVMLPLSCFLCIIAVVLYIKAINYYLELSIGLVSLKTSDMVKTIALIIVSLTIYAFYLDYKILVLNKKTKMAMKNAKIELDNYNNGKHAEYEELNKNIRDLSDEINTAKAELKSLKAIEYNN